jgi:hypothetical protein
MSELKELLEFFDKELVENIKSGAIPVKFGLFTRNLSTSDEKTFDKYKKIAYSNINQFPVTDKLKKVMKEIYSHKEFYDKKKIDLSNFVNPEESPITFKKHVNFFGEGKCFICGRLLTNDESKKDGIGPICKQKFGGESPLSSNERRVAGMVAFDKSLFKFANNVIGKSIKCYFKNRIGTISTKAVVCYKNEVLIAQWYFYRFKQIFNLY